MTQVLFALSGDKVGIDSTPRMTWLGVLLVVAGSSLIFAA